MAIEDATFLVQRGDEQFSCLGGELKDKLQGGDIMFVQRGAEQKSWVIKGMPWEGHDGSVWHVIVDGDSPTPLQLTGTRDLGDAPGIIVDMYSTDGELLKLSDTIQPGEEVVFMYAKDCHNLFIVNVDDPYRDPVAKFSIGHLTDTSKVTSLRGCFYWQREFLGEGVEYMDVSSCTNFESTFQLCHLFNGDVTNWDVSNATDLSYFVASAGAGDAMIFNRDVSNWDVSNCKDMLMMFYLATKFNQDISGWNTKNVTRMDYMFDFAWDFNQDLSKWCVPKIGSLPTHFNEFGNAEFDEAKQPQWGTCPRGEDS